MWQQLFRLIRTIQSGSEGRSQRLKNPYRQIAFENVEARSLLTGSPWHNPVLPGDVNGDGLVTSLDADAVRTTIANSNSSQVEVVTGTYPSNGGLPDVTDDWWVDQADIDYINNILGSGSGSGSDAGSSSGSGSGTGSDSGSGSGSGSGSSSGSGTAPVITGFNYEWNSGYLRIYGTIVDDQDPSFRSVSFGGILSGYGDMVEDDNSFEIVLAGWTQSGTISAWYTDSTGLTSQIVSMII